MPTDADAALTDLERVVVASVALTARVLAESAPELTFVQWRVLVVLGDAASHGASVGHIAAELRSRLPAASRLVTRLRARDLVQTSKDETDARITLVRLTPAGRLLWASVMQRRRSELAGLLRASGLGPTHVAAVRAIASALESAR